jgi:uracil-DNA glycosylase
MLRAERAMGVNFVPRMRAARKAIERTSPAPASPSVARPVVMQKTSVPPPVVAAAPMLTDLKPIDRTPIDVAKKTALLSQLDQEQVKVCKKCVLCKTRTNTVFAEGDPMAKLMLIGEGPGEDEDLSGRPFVGRSGQLLDKMMGAMGITRAQVYIANVVKCRPPNNRQPAPEETAACSPYLFQQIDWVQPLVIVTLGLPATQLILNLKKPMGAMRGVWHDWRGIKVMPTYHPSYVLRSYTEQTRRAVWSDLQMVMSELGLQNQGKSSVES